ELWGLETNFRFNFAQSWKYRFDMLFGFRYANLNETVDIGETSTGTASARAPLTNAVLTASDRFDTSNHFYGGQIGLSSQLNHGPWSLDIAAKFAIGDTNQEVNIGGTQTLAMANGSVAGFNSGILALPTNSGQQSQDHFSFIPELGVTLSYRCNEWFRIY